LARAGTGDLDEHASTLPSFGGLSIKGKKANRVPLQRFSGKTAETRVVTYPLRQNSSYFWAGCRIRVFTVIDFCLYPVFWVEIRMVRYWLRDDQYEHIAPLLPGKKSDPGRTARTTVCLSKPSFGLLAPEAPGVICRLNLDYGIACINALPGVHGKAYGIGCSPSWHAMQILKKSLSTVLSCEHINTPLGLQKNGNQALGRSRGGLSTKIHALVEGLGSLARFSLTAERHRYPFVPS
jgi:hypothetical protein